MFFEQLTEDEKLLIDLMRKFGVENDAEESGFQTPSNFVSCEYFLRYWERNKSRMSKVFGDQLILKKRFESVVEDDELFEDIDDLIRSDLFLTVKEDIYNMIKENNDITQQMTIDNGFVYSVENILESFVFADTTSIMKNQYQGPTLEIKLPNGKVFKLVKGCKLMKAIGKLAKFANVSELFEKVRINQSQIMSEAKISANLCLSIHPLDYITASYNSNGWHSCMNWEDGDYRRGVIEMMNSPFVITAYLESNHNKLQFWVDKDHPSVTWNSKKWREFFIVSEYGIFGIKGYPYWNEPIETEVLKWLRELFHSDETPYSNKVITWETKDKKLVDTTVNSDFYISMSCGPGMYNDFYNGNTYQAILAPNIQEGRVYLNYSGESECVVCGQDAEFDSSSHLGCESCIETHYCAWCGEEICCPEDVIEFDGEEYCEFCYLNHIPRCNCCSETLSYVADQDDFTSNHDGIKFYIGDSKGEVVLEDQFGFHEKLCCCVDCADRVFKLGVKEFELEHNNYNHFDHTPIIPLSHIKKLKPLNFYSPTLKTFVRTVRKLDKLR